MTAVKTFVIGVLAGTIFGGDIRRAPPERPERLED
jgi:hypothetical protein